MTPALLPLPILKREARRLYWICRVAMIVACATCVWWFLCAVTADSQHTFFATWHSRIVWAISCGSAVLWQLSIGKSRTLQRELDRALNGSQK